MAPQLGELSDNEKLLFRYIGEGKWEEAKALIGQPGVRVDCMDKTGMTPLMNAAYKGNRELSETLLANGADVNSNQHEHGYTALMFAALSGKPDVVELMLQKGGSTTATNTVGRTAAQMAGFVGQHQVTSLINNFFSRDDLDYYTVPRALDKEPKLQPKLAPALYKIIMNSNLHPVRISIILRDNPELLDNSKEIVRLLELLSEKMIKLRETNEIMSVKFHYLACIVRECAKSRNDNDGSMDKWFKLLLRERKPDMFFDKQEELIRSTLKSFPYMECALLQQMIQNIAPVKIGDSPTALSILNSGINGNRMGSDDDNQCTTCAEYHAKKCSTCKSVFYCNKDCQKLHWFTHKLFCKELATRFQEFQERYKRAEEERKKRDEEDRKLMEAEAEKAKAEAEKGEKSDNKQESIGSPEEALTGDAAANLSGKEAKLSDMQEVTAQGQQGSGDVQSKAGEE